MKQNLLNFVAIFPVVGLCVVAFAIAVRGEIDIHELAWQELRSRGLTITVNGLDLINKNMIMKEYWLESTNGQGYFQETKKEFYNAIRAGFRGFVKYESGMEMWINDKK